MQTFAALLSAKVAVTEEDFATAEAELRWAMDNNKKDSIAPLIALRLSQGFVSAR